MSPLGLNLIHLTGPVRKSRPYSTFFVLFLITIYFWSIEMTPLFFSLVEWCYLHPKKKSIKSFTPSQAFTSSSPIAIHLWEGLKNLEQIFGHCSILAFQFSLCCWFGKNWTNYTYICILWSVLWKFSWKKKCWFFIWQGKC